MQVRMIYTVAKTAVVDISSHNKHLDETLKHMLFVASSENTLKCYRSWCPANRSIMLNCKLVSAP